MTESTTVNGHITKNIDEDQPNEETDRAGLGGRVQSSCVLMEARCFIISAHQPGCSSELQCPEFFFFSDYIYFIDV